MDEHRILARPVLVPWEMGTAISELIRIQVIGLATTETAGVSKLLALRSISLTPGLTTIQKKENPAAQGVQSRTDHVLFLVYLDRGREPYEEQGTGDREQGTGDREQDTE